MLIDFVEADVFESEKTYAVDDHPAALRNEWTRDLSAWRPDTWGQRAEPVRYPG